MDFIIDAITEWIKDFLIEAITGNLSNMFGDVNTKVATIAGEVGKTPEQWNSGVFSMIHSLSEGLLFFGDKIIPFEDKFPRDTQLYRVMTTKPSDLVA